jgi:hypothetical protein
VANASRNAGAEPGRRRRWAPARDGLWDFLAPWLDEGARVAIVGAGNGDDLPLRRIARRAGEIVLVDIDPRAAQGARRRVRRPERRKVRVVGHDLTGGGVDRVALAALRGRVAHGGAADEVAPPDVGTPGGAGLRHAATSGDPLPGAPYDLVVGDLLYSQLLYPALLDLGVEPRRRAAVLARHAPALTHALVARLHASAPSVVHLHDPLAWWDGHEQPVSLQQILARAATDGPEGAESLVARGRGPHECDPLPALAELGLTPTASALWPWPFAAGVDYLVRATLARSP